MKRTSCTDILTPGCGLSVFRHTLLFMTNIDGPTDLLVPGEDASHDTQLFWCCGSDWHCSTCLSNNSLELAFSPGNWPDSRSCAVFTNFSAVKTVDRTVLEVTFSWRHREEGEDTRTRSNLTSWLSSHRNTFDIAPCHDSPPGGSQTVAVASQSASQSWFDCGEGVTRAEMKLQPSPKVFTCPVSYCWMFRLNNNQCYSLFFSVLKSHWTVTPKTKVL